MGHDRLLDIYESYGTIPVLKGISLTVAEQKLHHHQPERHEEDNPVQGADG